jgi:hypothetical protein
MEALWDTTGLMIQAKRLSQNLCRYISNSSLCLNPELHQMNTEFKNGKF